MIERQVQNLYHFTNGALPHMQKRGRQTGKKAALRGHGSFSKKH